MSHYLDLYFADPEIRWDRSFIRGRPLDEDFQRYLDDPPSQRYFLGLVAA